MAEYGLSFMDHTSIFSAKAASEAQDADSFEVFQILNDIGLTTSFESRSEITQVIVESAPSSHPIIPGVTDPASLARRVIEWLRSTLF